MQEMQNRREDNRLLCAELVELTWQDEAGRARRRVANLEDISLSGICLQVESPIPAGTESPCTMATGSL